MSRFTDFLARLRLGAQRGDQARLAAILELNRALATATDRKHLLVLLLDQAVALFGAERGFLLLCHGGATEVAMARSLDREPVRNAESKVSSTVVRRCLETRSGVFSEDAMETREQMAAGVAECLAREIGSYPSMARAVEAAQRGQGLEAILLGAEFLVVREATARRLEVLGLPFAWLCEHRGRVVTVPVNDN